jgi:UDP-N-acetylglucosamine--N-acetylmuramyl-(pentapeptide) pyrophosphoryl-undecaprenol N-acetylglucosamine transferase
VTFPGTPLAHARRTGLPMRSEITRLDRAATRARAREHFGLLPDRVTLLVYGGSQGALRLNETFGRAAADLVGAGVQVLHASGAGKSVAPAGESSDAPYVVVPYLDRMDLAYAAADLVAGRAGAGTVCEVTAVGLPAAYVPLPVGNGEQRLNADPVVAAGGGVLVEDAGCSPAWVRHELLPLLLDLPRREAMGRAAAAFGVRDGDERLADMVMAARGKHA